MAEGFDFATLFGETLKKGEKDVSTADIAKGKKVVGLYFSAHWCPPCRNFTPLLEKYYKTFSEQMEIVFISSDKDEGAFTEYYKTMSWLALSFELREKKNELSKKFGISGIPNLIILDPSSGEVITRDGRTLVTNKPDVFSLADKS